MQPQSFPYAFWRHFVHIFAVGVNWNTAVFYQWSSWFLAHRLGLCLILKLWCISWLMLSYRLECIMYILSLMKISCILVMSLWPARMSLWPTSMRTTHQSKHVIKSCLDIQTACWMRFMLCSTGFWHFLIWKCNEWESDGNARYPRVCTYIYLQCRLVGQN